MSTPKNPVMRKVADVVRERVRQYRAQRETVEAHLAADPGAPERDKAADRGAVALVVDQLEEVHGEVLPYVRKIRSLVPDVLGRSRLAAAYFLFGKASRGLQAIFLLARGGFHQEVLEIARSGREALDLVVLFLREAEGGPLLEKWFEGEIVENEKARAAIEKLIGQETEVPLSVGEMKAGIYGTLSKYSHVSYGALLESYDVHKADFDFDGCAGFHYVRAGDLRYIKGEITGLIVALKDFYATVGDLESYRELDVILRKHAPEMFDEDQRKKTIDDIQRNFGA